MRKWIICLAGIVLAGSAIAQDAALPTYAPDGKLLQPKDYRSWVFLSSGFDMSYTDSSEVKSHVFNNVFVNRVSYETFLKTGAWPDKTVLMLETRGGSADDPVLKHGQFQAGSPIGLSAHVKDASRGGWGFYAFGKAATGATMIAKGADCYSCHAANARTDTTFTQFYPELAARMAK